MPDDQQQQTQSHEYMPQDKSSSLTQSQETSSSRRGRPPLPQTPEGIWRRELLETVKLAQRARAFAGTQLAQLEKAYEGVDSLKTRLEIMRATSNLLNDLTKISSALLEQISKRPQEESASREFDFDKFLKEQG